MQIQWLQRRKWGGKRRGPEPCQEETINAWVSVEAVRTLEHHSLSLRFH